MVEPDDKTATAMLFERNDRLVIEAFQRGEFDYLEGVGEVSETDFFRVIAAKKVLEKLAATYPSPCKKHDVPLWVYITSDISMRFQGGPSVPCHSLRSAFGRDGQCLRPRHGTEGDAPGDGGCDPFLSWVQQEK